MGWSNSHPHVFIIGTTFYGIPDPEYGFEMKDEKEASLHQVVSEQKSRFSYEYDFGDCWQHGILIEEILPRKGGCTTHSALAVSVPVPLRIVAGSGNMLTSSKPSRIQTIPNITICSNG